MNKADLLDDLLPEYDLTKLRDRGTGPGHKSFAGKPIVQIEPDVAWVFPMLQL